MTVLFLVSLLLWTLVASNPSKSEKCSSEEDGLDPASLNFVHMPMLWSEAEQFCQSQGGHLLQDLSCNTMKVLEQEAQKHNVPNCAQWVGHNEVKDAEFKETKGPSNCPYIIIDPDVQLLTTPNCNLTYGSICVIDLETDGSDPTPQNMPNNRRKRDLSMDVLGTLSNMANNMQDPSFVVQTAVNVLEMMELGVIEPTFSEEMKYLQLLKNVTSSLTSADTDQLSNILGCSNGIVTLSTSSCAYESLSESEHSDMSSLVFEILEEVSLRMASSGTGVITISQPLVTITVSRQKVQQLAESVIGDAANGPYYVMPSLTAMESLLKKETEVNVQMFSFMVNPLPNTPSENITGSVSSLSLKDLNGGNINFYNLSDSIQIFLPRSDAPEVTSQNVTLQGDTVITLTFDVTDTNSTIVLTMESNMKQSLQLQLARGTPSQNPPFLYSTILNQTSGYRWLITPDMLQVGDGPWYVQAGQGNSTKNDSVIVWISIFPTKCLFWNSNLKAWSTYGCLVGEQTEPNMTHCLCNHLTTFGSSFFVMPNQVDLSRTAEYFATVKNNYVVPALLGSFFTAYLLALIWACRADKRAFRKGKITLVKDNHPCARYSYLLTVYTGYRRGANTSAQVEITLQGSEGESRHCHLTDSNKPLFERGGVDIFLFSTPFSLGELQTIVVSQDNSGAHPSWYLCKVTVQDLQTSRYWHFLCSSWLSSVKGDGLTKRTFHVAPNSEITSFGKIFQNRTSTGFRDQHIWMSVVNPPNRSPFTRAQRISCCMSLLLCTMAINIMFFNVPQNAKSPVLISAGSLEITLEDAMIGIESGLLMFPINILIVTIFRYTKPRLRMRKHKDSSTCDQKDAGVTMSTVVKDAEQLVSILNKSKRNKVSALERPLESHADLCAALYTVHDILQLMQGESDSDSHWAYCSQFVLCSLHRLAETMERLDVRAFPSEEDYRGVQNTITLLRKKAEMVFSSHMQNGSSLSAPKQEKSKSCWLPWWFVFIGWFLLVSSSGISTFFTLLYGFVYGKEKAIKWVIALGLSLFQSIFILQPLKILGLAIFFALTLKPVVVDDSEEVGMLLAEQRKKCTHISEGATL
ncbi:polycystic kidney disease protein 1-like 2 [Brienomyrus brachyistius]|uniref:polycystic kidney disease protein 1-like 2 n=1 Tax=Brienomyrus brachyistius TaxID=42636 RepID=UPI0020B28F2A|nr:polycystic kidney disease protein 1-like 2 [Brienomyrus brachyistius]